MHLPKIFRKDIKMLFGLDKCGRVRGKVITAEGVELPEGTTADVQDSYKYFRIQEANGNHDETIRKSATTK